MQRRVRMDESEIFRKYCSGRLKRRSYGLAWSGFSSDLKKEPYLSKTNSLKKIEKIIQFVSVSRALLVFRTSSIKIAINIFLSLLQVHSFYGQIGRHGNSASFVIEILIPGVRIFRNNDETFAFPYLVWASSPALNNITVSISYVFFIAIKAFWRLVVAYLRVFKELQQSKNLVCAGS